MRKPTLADVFTAVKIANKMDIKNFKFDPTKEINQLGAEAFIFFIDNIPKAENEVFELIASIKEVSIEEARNIGVDELPIILKELKELEGMENFIKSVANLTASNPWT